MSRFLTPCFVRVQNPAERQELKVWLTAIGYRCKNLTIERLAPIVVCSATGYAYSASSVDGKYDCGTNIDLFKALAAMNDSNDYMQWFTDGKEWILCDREDWMDMYSVLCAGYGVDAKVRSIELDQHRKATVEELVERFKNLKP